jgi:SAM-dependent methyltransferase
VVNLVAVIPIVRIHRRCLAQQGIGDGKSSGPIACAHQAIALELVGALVGSVIGVLGATGGALGEQQRHREVATGRVADDPPGGLVSDQGDGFECIVICCAVCAQVLAELVFGSLCDVQSVLGDLLDAGHARKLRVSGCSENTFPAAGWSNQNLRMPDAIFDDPKLARVYDPLDPDRSDLDVYVDLALELGASSVLDVGCGTGTFAWMLAARGIQVTAVDPARASLDVARAKASADAVRWLFGDATTLPPMRVDAAFMTGNVAQVFLTDDAWSSTLRGISGALRPQGQLVFETRDPARRAWEQWTPDRTRVVVDVPNIGVVESWAEVTAVDGPLVTFRSITAFRREGTEIESTSTLRFRERSEIEDSLVRAGYELIEVRDAPDRPGNEFVFVSRSARGRAKQI